MAEKDKMKCCDCKYYRPVGKGFEGICEMGHGVPNQREGGVPLGYVPFDRRSCWHGVFGPTMEKRLEELEKRLEFFEQTERVKKPNKPEVLVQIFKLIGDTYTQEEIDKAIQLLRDEISKAAGHYHEFGPWKSTVTG